MTVSDNQMREYINASCSNDHYRINDIPKALMANKKFVLSLARTKGVSALVLRFISADLQDDFEVVSAFIQNHEVNNEGFFDKDDSPSDILNVIKGSKCYYTKDCLGESVLKNRRFWELLNQRISIENNKIAEYNQQNNANIRLYPLFDIDKELLAVSEYFEEKKKKASSTPNIYPTTQIPPQQPQKPLIMVEQSVYGYSIKRMMAEELGLIAKIPYTGPGEIYRLTPNELKELQSKYQVEFVIAKAKIIIYTDGIRYAEDPKFKKIVSRKRYDELVNDPLFEVETQYVETKPLILKTVVQIYRGPDGKAYLDGTTAYYMHFCSEIRNTKYHLLTETELRGIMKNPCFEVEEHQLGPNVIGQLKRK